MTWNLQKSFGTKTVLARSILAFSTIAIAVGCGKQNGSVALTGDSAQIIGGNTVSSTDDLSKSIAILVNVDTGSLCTASIYSDSILITAAHCVDGSPASLRVAFGTEMDSPDVIVRPVKNYVSSPLWAKRQNMNVDTGDLAVVKFLGGLPPGYKPATLLTDASQLKDGLVVTLAGYGISVGKPAEGSDGGAGVLREVQVTISKVAFSQTEVLMDQTAGKGACHGDSGGPAYVLVGGERMLFGVTSRGVNDPKNDCSAFAAYTNLTAYAKWLGTAIQKLNTMPANSRPNTSRSFASAR